MVYEFLSTPSPEVLANPAYYPKLKGPRPRLPSEPDNRWGIWKFILSIYYSIIYWNVRNPDLPRKLTEVDKLELKLKLETKKREIYAAQAKRLESQIDKWINLNASIIEENYELQERVDFLKNQVSELETQLLNIQMEGEKNRVKLERDIEIITAKLKTQNAATKNQSEDDVNMNKSKVQAEEKFFGEGDCYVNSTDDSA